MDRSTNFVINLSRYAYDTSVYKILGAIGIFFSVVFKTLKTLIPIGTRS